MIRVALRTRKGCDGRFLVKAEKSSVRWVYAVCGVLLFTASVCWWGVPVGGAFLLSA